MMASGSKVSCTVLKNFCRHADTAGCYPVQPRPVLYARVAVTIALTTVADRIATEHLKNLRPCHDTSESGRLPHRTHVTDVRCRATLSFFASP